MANYNVDISVSIKNTNKLNAFNKQLKTTAETAKRARQGLKEIGQTVKSNLASTNNLSKALDKTQKAFNKTILGTKASVLAARDLATAERMVNKELKERTALMNRFRFQGGGSGFKTFSQSANQVTSPNVFTTAQQKSINRQNIKQGRNPIPFGPQQFMGPLPMQGPMFGPMQGPMAGPKQMLGPGNFKGRILGNLGQSKLEREIAAAGSNRGGLGGGFKAFNKNVKKIQADTKKMRGTLAQMSASQFAATAPFGVAGGNIGPALPPPTSFLSRMGFGANANAKGPFAMQGGASARLKGGIGSALIGGGFPALFGAGGISSAFGAIAGGAGGALAPGGGFAASIFATAIAAQIEKTIAFNKAVDDLNVSIKATGGTSLFTSKQVREFATSLGISKDEALEALKAFKQFEASARISLTKFFGSEAIFDTFAGLKDNASILNALPNLSKELSLEQAKIALETLKTNGASAAELKLREQIFDKNTDILKQKREKGNFLGISKDINLGDLLDPFRGFELGKEGNIFQRIVNSSTKSVEELKKSRVDEFFDSDKFKQQLEDSKEKLRIQREFNKELERQAIIKAPVDELERLLDPLNQIDALGKSIGDSFSESFKGIIKGSMTAQEALRNLFMKTADHFLDMAAQMLAAQIRTGIFGLFGNMFGGKTTDVFAGMNRGPTNPNTLTMKSFANGGQPPVGRPSLVGERGPELFVPNSAGNIIPNHELGGMGGSTNIVVNVDASGSSVEGDEQQGRELGQLISVAIQSELIKQKRPGGLLT